jgi:8-oxo-dGTP pyrophosphatase MutT (NUDIX family)
MSKEELETIRHAGSNFNLLWDTFCENNYIYKNKHKAHVYSRSLRLFQWLCFYTDTRSESMEEPQSSELFITLMLNEAIRESQFLEPEWEFPKGRPQEYERPYEAALREFEEETGLSKKYIQILKDHSILEKYTSYDKKEYRNYFFIGIYDGPIPVSKRLILDNVPSRIDLSFDISDVQLVSEVSQVSLMTPTTCLSHIRPYHEEKKRCLLEAWNAIQKTELTKFIQFVSPTIQYSPSRDGKSKR